MPIQHPPLVNLIQMAYSAERAASFAYQGHAGSLRNPQERARVKQIEQDEWDHRAEMLALMKKYDIPINQYYEWRFYLIGKFISASCYVIGWFMPYYFAGRLESGNVCEYIRMKRYFNELGITEHDQALLQMAVREKEHEVCFLEMIRNHSWLPWFESIFGWGVTKSLNDLDNAEPIPVDTPKQFCNTK